MNRRFVATFASMLIVCGAALRAESPLFERASPIHVGRGSGQIVLVDVNHDGHLDIVTQHLLRHCITVLLGDGRGEFKPQAAGPMQLDYQPGTLAIADIDGDNHVDLAISFRRQLDEFVQIWRGKGTGEFTSRDDAFLVSHQPIELYKPSLSFVDVNQDSHLDLISGNGRRNTVEIFFGDGKGAFAQQPVLTLAPGYTYYTYLPADVNEDGQVDLATVASAVDGSTSLVAIQLGDGSGSFRLSKESIVRVPIAARIAAVADFNGDQHEDIVLTHDDQNFASFLVNQGDGIFSLSKASPLHFPHQPFTVCIADVNHDQRPDLIAATVEAKEPQFASKIAVLCGKDTVDFEVAAGSPFEAGRGAYRLAVGDFNEDRKPDVVATSFEGDDLTLLLSR